MYTKYLLLKSHNFTTDIPNWKIVPFQVTNLAILSLSPFLSLSVSLLLLRTRNLQKIWHTTSDTKSLWHWCCFTPSSLPSKILPLSNVSTCNKCSMMHLVVCSRFTWGVQRLRKVVNKDPLFQTRQLQQWFWSSWPLGCHFQVFPLVRNFLTLVLFTSDWDRWQYVWGLWI